MKSEKIKVTLLKSGSGRLPAHRATLEGLGLRRIRQSVILKNSEPVRGMINKISYLVKVEQV